MMLQFNRLSACILSSPQKIIDSSRRTLFISRRAFRDYNRPPILSLSLTMQENLDVLIHACGNNRYTLVCFIQIPNVNLNSICCQTVRFSIRTASRHRRRAERAPRFSRDRSRARHLLRRDAGQLHSSTNPNNHGQDIAEPTHHYIPKTILPTHSLLTGSRLSGVS